MLWILLTAVLMSQAQQETESQVRCKEDAEAKSKILTDAISQCQWVVPTGDELANGPNCTGVQLIGERYEQRASTWTGGGHNGHLMCGSPYNEKESSYVNNRPMFAFTCSICTTSNNTPQLDQECIRTMRERELALCQAGVPRMMYRYEPGSDPVPVRSAQ